MLAASGGDIRLRSAVVDLSQRRPFRLLWDKLIGRGLLARRLRPRLEIRLRSCWRVGVVAFCSSVLHNLFLLRIDSFLNSMEVALLLFFDFDLRLTGHRFLSGRVDDAI